MHDTKALPTDPGLATVPIAEPAPRGRYVALVPGEAVPLVTLDLPNGLRGRAREQVAQRQLADMLGADAASLQLRPFAPEGMAETWSKVMLAERAQVAKWRGQTGGRCAAVLPDYLALPVSEGVWTVVGTPDRLRVRFGPGDGATTTEGALCLQAARLVAAGHAPDRVLRFGAPLPAFEGWLAQAGIPLETDPTKAGSAPLRAFSRGELTLDLRADPQAARTRLQRQVRAWQWPVLTGAVAAALWAATQLTVIRAVEEETATVTTRALQATRQNFVPAGPILDMRVQVARVLADERAALRASNDDVSPLDLFADAAPVVSGAGADLQSVAWEPSGGLRLVLQAGDFAAVDALVDALGAEGLRVTVRDARLAEDSGRVTADLEIGLPENGG
ncbi:GspL/Epsl periplasmic domain-containing protein [Antarctobacter sp.]|uniref:GspL/Epsl periplasmic domain-containing protein n=1 Tax=Antarctobacter sp. TaxID=1872577 RepID=UPI002B2704C2|nr:type II secretion system protein GspL [Antarctobacter sp.]